MNFNLGSRDHPWCSAGMMGELQAEDRKRLEGKAMAAEKGEGEPLTIDELSRLNGYEVNAMDEVDWSGVEPKEAPTAAAAGGPDPEVVGLESDLTRVQGPSGEPEHPKSPRSQVTQTLSEMADANPELDVLTADDMLARYQLGNAGDELRGGAIGTVGAATVVAPGTMLPILGRLAGAEIAGEAAKEVLLQEGFCESDASMGAAVLNVVLAGHLTAGGELPGAAALTMPARAGATPQSLMDRLKGAMEELGHWRPDPNAMGSGGLPLTRRVPTEAAAEATGATKATVSEAPLNVNRAPTRVVTASGDKVTQMHVTGVEGCQSHHIVSWTNRHTKDHPLVKAAGYDLKNDPGNLILLPDAEAAAKSTTFRSVHQGRHVDTYSEKMAIEMKDIHDFGQSNGWTQVQYREALERVISEARTKLRSGEIQLNKTTRESLGLPMKGTE